MVVMVSDLVNIDVLFVYVFLMLSSMVLCDFYTGCLQKEVGGGRRRMKTGGDRERAVT